MKRGLIYFVGFCVATTLAQPTFHGYVQNWTAFRAIDEHDLILLRNRFRLNTTLRSDWARGYASLNVNDELQSGMQSPELNLRELYMDLYFDNFDLRIGKQQVVWGKADGVFINDIVNPLDLRYFLMQDFEDIRMGVSMVKANAYRGSIGLEVVWIPKFEPWQFAEPESDWAFHQLDSINVGFPIYFHSQEPQIPNYTLRNSEFGLKVSSFLLGTDVSLIFLNSFQDQPVFDCKASSIIIDTTTIPGMTFPSHGDVLFTHERANMYGFNFSHPFGPTVVRGEFGYFDDYSFNLAPDLSATAITLQEGFVSTFRSDYLQAMIGIDVNGPWGTNISTQYIRKQIVDYVEAIQPAKEVDQWWTLLLSGTFWNEEGNARTLAIYDQTHESGLSRFMFGYKIADNVTLDVGMDFIWGTEESIFGQFDKNDNIYMKLTYSF